MPEAGTGGTKVALDVGDIISIAGGALTVLNMSGDSGAKSEKRKPLPIPKFTVNVIDGLIVRVTHNTPTPK